MMGTVTMWAGQAEDVGGELVFSVSLEDVLGAITLHGYGTDDAALSVALVAFAPHWPMRSERPLGPIQVRRIGRALDVWGTVHEAMARAEAHRHGSVRMYGAACKASRANDAQPSASPWRIF